MVKQKLLVLCVVLILMIPGASAYSVTFDETPGGLVGGGIGFGWNSIVYKNIPGGLLITNPVVYNRFINDWVYTNFVLFAEGNFGFLQAGPGDIGVVASIDILVPDFYFGLGVGPRYKVEFTFSTTEPLYSVAPWAGWNFSFGVYEGIDYEFVFTTGLITGVELQLFVPNLYFLLQFDINVWGRSVGGELVEQGIVYAIDYDYTNYLVKLGVSYRIY